MKARQARPKPASFTLYRKRGASALAACGGYVGAFVVIWAARQSSAQVLVDVVGEAFGTMFGAAVLVLSTVSLTMAALNTPIAIFTPDGLMVGGIRFLFGYKRIVPWSAITAFDVVRLRNRTLMLIQLRPPATSGDRQHAVKALWAFLNSDMRFSERFMALPLSEFLAELQRRFAKELHDNRIKIIGW